VTFQFLHTHTKRLHKRVTRKLHSITDTPFPNECNRLLPSLRGRELRARPTRSFINKRSSPLRRLVGRANGTKLDIAEGDSSVGLLGLDITGLTRGSGAGTTSSADLVGANGVGRVEPEHVGSVVVPDTEDESHTGIEILAKAGKTTLLGE
jgi:hypothetical protein